MELIKQDERWVQEIMKITKIFYIDAICTSISSVLSSGFVGANRSVNVVPAYTGNDWACLCLEMFLFLAWEGESTFPSAGITMIWNMKHNKKKILINPQPKKATFFSFRLELLQRRKALLAQILLYVYVLNSLIWCQMTRLLLNVRRADWLAYCIYKYCHVQCNSNSHSLIIYFFFLYMWP